MAYKTVKDEHRLPPAAIWEMSQKIGSGFVGNFCEFGKIDNSRISRESADNNIRFFLHRLLFLWPQNPVYLFVQSIKSRFKEFSAWGLALSVSQCPPKARAKPMIFLSMAPKRKVNSQIHHRAGQSLDIEKGTLNNSLLFPGPKFLLHPPLYSLDNIFFWDSLPNICC